MFRLLHIAAAVMLLAAAPGYAQSESSIEDASWLAGRWVGEGLGGQLEETWAPPVGGQMVGHFRLVVDGAPQFYEIMLLDVVAEGLRLRVKHFNPDFVGWEERDRWHTFEPVSVSEDVLRFDAFVIRRLGDDAIEMRIVFGSQAGPREETLRFIRAPL